MADRHEGPVEDRGAAQADGAVVAHQDDHPFEKLGAGEDETAAVLDYHQAGAVGTYGKSRTASHHGDAGLGPGARAGGLIVVGVGQDLIHEVRPFLFRLDAAADPQGRVPGEEGEIARHGRRDRWRVEAGHRPGRGGRSPAGIAGAVGIGGEGVIVAVDIIAAAAAALKIDRCSGTECGYGAVHAEGQDPRLLEKDLDGLGGIALCRTRHFELIQPLGAVHADDVHGGTEGKPWRRGYVHGDRPAVAGGIGDGLDGGIGVGAQIIYEELHSCFGIVGRFGILPVIAGDLEIRGGHHQGRGSQEKQHGDYGQSHRQGDAVFPSPYSLPPVLFSRPLMR